MKIKLSKSQWNNLNKNIELIKTSIVYVNYDKSYSPEFTVVDPHGNKIQDIKTKKKIAEYAVVFQVDNEKLTKLIESLKNEIEELIRTNRPEHVEPNENEIKKLQFFMNKKDSWLFLSAHDTYINAQKRVDLVKTGVYGFFYMNPRITKLIPKSPTAPTVNNQ